MLITIPDHRPISWNKYYAGKHWAERKAHSDFVHALVAASVEVGVEPFGVPVEIIVTAYFKSHPQDPDNVCSKPYIDGLIGRVIHNDTMQYVSSVTTRSRKAQENRVEIEIRPTV